MEELMEHWFFIGGHPIKALFRNCPGSAKRSGERGRRNQWNTGDGNTGSAAARDSKRNAGPSDFCPASQFRFAWRKTERFSKTGPAPNAEFDNDHHGLLLGPRILSK